MSSIRILALMMGLTLVYGCGGSDGNGGGLGNGGGNTQPLVVLTTDNADALAGVAAEIVVEDNVFGAIGAPGVPFVSTSTDAANVLMSIANLPMPPGVMAAQSSMDDCAVSGTVDVTFDQRGSLCRIIFWPSRVTE